MLLAQCGGALSCSSSGLTLLSNLATLLYKSLCNDNKPSPLPFQSKDC